MFWGVVTNVATLFFYTFKPYAVAICEQLKSQQKSIYKTNNHKYINQIINQLTNLYKVSFQDITKSKGIIIQKPGIDPETIVYKRINQLFIKCS